MSVLVIFIENEDGVGSKRSVKMVTMKVVIGWQEKDGVDDKW